MCSLRDKAHTQGCVFGRGVDLAPPSAICWPWTMIDCVEARLYLWYLHSSVQAGAGSSGSSLKAGSTPLPPPTLINALNCCSIGYHPQCLLRKYLMTSARFLSQTQQVRLLGTSRILIFSRTCFLYRGG